MAGWEIFLWVWFCEGVFCLLLFRVFWWWIVWFFGFRGVVLLHFFNG